MVYTDELNNGFVENAEPDKSYGRLGDLWRRLELREVSALEYWWEGAVANNDIRSAPEFVDVVGKLACRARCG